MADFVLKLADSVKSSTGVHVAYGDPVKLGDTTLIPVALGWSGFGGGESRNESFPTSGGGGGGAAIPIGAYVSDSAGTRFEPNPIALLVVAVPFVGAVTTGVALVVRSFRGHGRRGRRR
jgi:uncharacterized spore protein YtfJ